MYCICVVKYHDLVSSFNVVAPKNDFITFLLPSNRYLKMPLLEADIKEVEKPTTANTGGLSEDT